ncbi:MAG: thymidine phosphorylase [Candidatus Nanoarchaeia archaeon]
MELKIKNFNWLAGRPVVILNQETAKQLNVYVNDRIAIETKQNIYAVVDIFPELVKTGEIGLSKEISDIVKKKDNSKIEVTHSELSEVGHIIKKKLAGKELSRKEITLLVKEIANNRLAESEIAYFVAAEKIKGMSSQEVKYLTEAMSKAGKQLDIRNEIVADKHCIGGVAGNRTTPIVVSICAAAGLTMPKNSSRAITSASGTADVIETIANVEFTPREIENIIKKTNACLVWGGALGLAPADDKIIHVEKVLNLDVESQLLASILSKKIAANSNHVLIDIPYGKSAKIASKKKARHLARKFENLSKGFDMSLKTVLTDGKQPIGNGIGPVLEMLDVIDVLKNKPSSPEDLRKKSLKLAIEIMKLCKIKSARKKAKEILSSGKAYEKFKEIINTQNRENNFDKKVSALKPAKYKKVIRAGKTGKIKEIDNNKINYLARVLGAPESKASGVYLHKHLDKVEKGEQIMTIYAETKSKINDGLTYIDKFKPVVIN